MTNVIGTNIAADNRVAHMQQPGEIIKEAREQKGWSQKDLADRVGISQPAIKKIEGGQTIKSKHLPKIAEELGIELSLIDKSLKSANRSDVASAQYGGNKENVKNGSQAEPELIQNALFREGNPRFSRVPIRGRAMGGDSGFVILSDGDTGEAVAPPQLAGVPGAYAVYVVGDSMLERYREGEIVYVHPYRPAVTGDDVVVQLSEDGGATIRGYIKRLVSRDRDHVKVRQLNPPKTITFPAASVYAVHLIIMGGKP